MSSIYVYGTTWCGYTRQQVSELTDELTKQGHNVSQSMRFIECDKEENEVCQGLSGYPLAMVHRDDKPPSPTEVAAVSLGKRPVQDLMREWHKACGTAPDPAPAPPSHTGEPLPSGDQAIYVYGTTWCGYTRQQVAEVKDALSAEGADVDQSLHFVECDKVDNQVCQQLSGYPLSIVHGEKPPSKHVIAKAPLGKRPAEELLHELHDARSHPPGPDHHDDKQPGIYVYGTTWCGYTRQQVAEVQDALQQDDQLDRSMLHYIQCDKDGKDDPVCQSLQAFPLTMVHRGPPTPEQAAKHEPGKQPAHHLLKKLHRKLEHPSHHHA